MEDRVKKIVTFSLFLSSFGLGATWASRCVDHYRKAGRIDMTEDMCKRQYELCSRDQRIKGRLYKSDCSLVYPDYKLAVCQSKCKEYAFMEETAAEAAMIRSSQEDMRITPPLLG